MMKNGLTDGKTSCVFALFLFVKVISFKNKNKINKKLNGILYQNYTTYLYQFKTAVESHCEPA